MFSVKVVRNNRHRPGMSPISPNGICTYQSIWSGTNEFMEMCPCQERPGAVARNRSDRHPVQRTVSFATAHTGLSKSRNSSIPSTNHKRVTRIILQQEVHPPYLSSRKLKVHRLTVYIHHTSIFKPQSVDIRISTSCHVSENLHVPKHVRDHVLSTPKLLHPWSSC